MDAPPSDNSLPDWLARRAVTHARHPALLADPVAWTFADLDARASDAARRLAALGISANDRVALLAGNGPAFVVVAHALGRLGAILVPLNTRLTAPELAWLLADVKATHLLHDAANAEAARAAWMHPTDPSPRPPPPPGEGGLIQLGHEGPVGPPDATIALRERIALDAV